MVDLSFGCSGAPFAKSLAAGNGFYEFGVKQKWPKAAYSALPDPKKRRILSFKTAIRANIEKKKSSLTTESSISFVFLAKTKT